jgi:hypothetical protein
MDETVKALNERDELREAISEAVRQMDYCDKDGRPQSLCPCCFQKVRGLLVGAMNEQGVSID